MRSNPRRRANNLFFVQTDIIQRHMPRRVDGAERLCAHLETARGRRGKSLGASLQPCDVDSLTVG